MEQEIVAAQTKVRELEAQIKTKVSEQSSMQREINEREEKINKLRVKLAETENTVKSVQQVAAINKIEESVEGSAKNFKET